MIDGRDVLVLPVVPVGQELERDLVIAHLTASRRCTLHEAVILYDEVIASTEADPDLRRKLVGL